MHTHRAESTRHCGVWLMALGAGGMGHGSGSGSGGVGRRRSPRGERGERARRRVCCVPQPVVLVGGTRAHGYTHARNFIKKGVFLTNSPHLHSPPIERHSAVSTCDFLCLESARQSLAVTSYIVIRPVLPLAWYPNVRWRKDAGAPDAREACLTHPFSMPQRFTCLP